LWHLTHDLSRGLATQNPNISSRFNDFLKPVNLSKILSGIPKLDFKLKAQILDVAQLISSNIAEGYGRKSINEYLYFLNVALGSSGEILTQVRQLE